LLFVAAQIKSVQRRSGCRQQKLPNNVLWKIEFIFFNHVQRTHKVYVLISTCGKNNWNRNSTWNVANSLENWRGTTRGSPASVEVSDVDKKRLVPETARWGLEVWKASVKTLVNVERWVVQSNHTESIQMREGIIADTGVIKNRHVVQNVWEVLLSAVWIRFIQRRNGYKR
jgi:hypothetical protein